MVAINNLKSNKPLIIALVIISTAAVFISNFFIPLGFIQWVFFIIPILLVYWAFPLKHLIPFTAFISILIIINFIINYYTANTHIPYIFAIFNRSSGIFLFLLIAILMKYQKTARLKTKQSEDYFRAIFDNNSAAIALIELDTTISMVNEAYCQLSGYTKEEVIGMSWTKQIPPDDLERLKEYNRIRLSTPELAPDKYEFKFYRKDSEIRYGLMSVSMIQSSRKIITSFIDITQRKLAEEQLRLSEQKYKAMYENMAAASCIDELIYKDGIATDYRIIDINPAYETIIGVSREKAIGTLASELYGTPIPFLDIYTSVAETGSPHTFEAFFPPINKYLHITASCPDKGKFSTVITDVTDRRQYEDRLRQYLRELERSNQELEQFAYVASHDLQEPLRMVSSFTQLLSKKYGNQLDEQANEFINFAVDGASRMQQLINDLLSYSRINAKSKPFVSVDMNAELGKVRAIMRETIQERNAVITNTELPTVIADEGQMIQILQNLINNAIKFNLNNPVINISCEETNLEWIFSVKDNGIGIDPLFHERIFLIFQRLHGKDEYPGTGIGLAICKRIAEHHHGTTWVDSEEGKGSTFYFSINKTPDKKATGNRQ